MIATEDVSVTLSVAAQLTRESPSDGNHSPLLARGVERFTRDVHEGPLLGRSGGGDVDIERLLPAGAIGVVPFATRRPLGIRGLAESIGPYCPT
jgi:hypothetical protein